MIKKVDIKDLKKGHFVVDIADQRGTFNLTRAGHIKSTKVIIGLIAKGVSSVLIDTSKTLVEPVKTVAKKTTPQRSKKLQATGPKLLEVTQAKSLFSHSKKIQQQVFNDVQQGQTIDMAPIIDATNQTISVIFKNPDALICVINIRKKNEYLLEHSVAVSVLMTVFARYLELDADITQQLAIGALLHDVGKIKLPSEILNKTDKLNAEEFRIMQEHVNHSINIIKSTPGISSLSLEVAAQHHERADGSGYPLQLKQDEISTYGSMIAICDIFDALTAERIYKEYYNPIKAFNILRSLASDGKLNARLVDMFIKCLGVYPVGTLVELNSQRLAIVESRNQDNPIKPKVRCFYDIEKAQSTMAKDIDLAENTDYIVRSVRAQDYDFDLNKIIDFLLTEG